VQGVITHGVAASLLAFDPLDIEACLEYQADDPYAVRLVVGAAGALAGSPVAWVFGRQLLVEGVAAPAGKGDVRVRPYEPGQTAIELRVDAGLAVLILRTEDVRCFLTATYEAVPLGAEGLEIAWEEELARLTEGRP
jgi:hypothetical protein